MGIIGIFNFFYKKMDFSCFFSTKNWEIVQFHLDNFFVPPTFVGIHLFSLKVVSTGLGLIFYIIATGGHISAQFICSNSNVYLYIAMFI
jgi:cytochrome bd-type quinol oxidase subunit 1